MVESPSQEPYSGLPNRQGWQLSFDDPEVAPPQPRVYPLTAGDEDAGDLTEEEMAVVFAMTSRRPEPFDEIARQVNAQKAADFHERWVLGYGHASVAEHAVLHMAVEDISRLACDTLEDNRLASYTEKSSRYQVLPRYSYHAPEELPTRSNARRTYVEACDHLLETYHDLVQRVTAYLPEEMPQREDETDAAYGLRLRRIVTDSCRFLLPAATLTNVGVTANARTMEHLIRKLLSSDLLEERRLGYEFRRRSREITPTLVKYAERNPYLKQVRDRQLHGAVQLKEEPEDSRAEVTLEHYDPDAEAKLVTALLFRSARLSYGQVWQRVKQMRPWRRHRVIADTLAHMGPHDAPPREFEVVDFTFGLTMDYGAYREFKRHRMQTYIPQPLTVENGYVIPPLIERAGLAQDFHAAIARTEDAYRTVARDVPMVAPYLVTHAHKRRVLSKMNLRECYHLFQLRTQAQAHFSIREPIEQAMRLAVEAQPELFRHMRLRQYPEWWPFQERT